MFNLKKIFSIFLLFNFMFVNIYAQNDVNVSKSEVSLNEADIILADNDVDSAEDHIDLGNDHKSGLSIFIRMIVVLIIVVVLIYFVFYFIKKKTNIVKNDDDFLRRAAYINIAPGKTVEVITLIDKAYLIGVTEDNITLLGEINDEELIKAMNIASDKKNNTKKPSNFSEVLDMFLVKGNKQKNVFSETEKQVDNIGSEEFLNKDKVSSEKEDNE